MTRQPQARKRRIVRPLAVLAMVFGLLGLLGLLGLTATAASAHGDEKNKPASDLVRIAIAVLEVHPTPSAAVEDKILDAQKAQDKRGVDIALVKQAQAALMRGDVPATKRLLERALGECPDPDVLFVSDQPPKPPCIPPAHSVAEPGRSVGGASEVIILIVAGLLAVAGLVVIRRPFVRNTAGSTA